MTKEEKKPSTPKKEIKNENKDTSTKVETKCPLKYYKDASGECTQVTCDKSGWEVIDSGRACGIICEDYFYRSADLKSCKQKECKGTMTVHKSGRFCEREETS